MTEPGLPSVLATDRWVAFGDVLGFQGLSQATPAGMLANLYQGTLAVAAASAAAGGLAPGWLATINVRLFSDSVIMWTTTDNAAEFIHLLQCVRCLLCQSFAFDLPMRAAICHGELATSPLVFQSHLVSGETVVGAALTNAYLLSESQGWSGGVVDDAAMALYATKAAHVGSAAPTLADLVTKGHALRYPVPVKQGRSRVVATDHWAIQWPTMLPAPVTAGVVRSAFAGHGKSTAARGVPGKIKQTVAFVKATGMLK